MTRNATVSTGEAARVCGVKPDTILKWIKKGKLSATRTLGGHFRVEVECLQPFAVNPAEEGDGQTKDARTVPCWEFHAKTGTVNERCEQCIVYLAGATKCYVLSSLRDLGVHGSRLCDRSCEACDYYQMINKDTPMVLVVTPSKRTKELPPVPESVILRVVCCGYEAARMIEKFRPDIVVVDVGLEAHVAELVRHLKHDPRIRRVRVLRGIWPDQARRPGFADASRSAIPFTRLGSHLAEMTKASPRAVASAAEATGRSLAPTDLFTLRPQSPGLAARRPRVAV